MGKWTEAAKKLKAQIDQDAEKASDVDVLVQAMATLPPGQLKKLFTEDVLAVLSKYGYEV